MNIVREKITSALCVGPLSGARERVIRELEKYMKDLIWKATLEEWPTDKVLGKIRKDFELQ